MVSHMAWLIIPTAFKNDSWASLDKAAVPFSFSFVFMGINCGFPHFRGNRHSIRNPSSQKGTYGQNMGSSKNGITGKLLKL